MRPWIALSAASAAVIGGLLFAGQTGAPPPGDLRLHAGAAADDAALFAALPAGLPADPALALTHPPDGAPWPAAFPPPALRWPDAGGGHRYEITLSADGVAPLRALSRAPAFTPDAADWARFQGAAAVTVTVRAAPPPGSAAPLRAGPPATLRPLPAEEGPGGMILAGVKHAPPGAEGFTPLMTMHLAVLGLDLGRAAEPPRVLFRSSYGPHPWEMGDQGGGSRCVSCHDLASDGRRVAVFSQTEAEAPGRFHAPNGFLTVLELPEGRVLAQAPHAFLPVFHPTDPDRLAYAWVEETIGAKTQMLVPRGDIHALDLRTGEARPVAGASDPEHVENVPAFSADGQTLAFVRAPRGEALHGSEGRLEIVTVPWNGGAGGAATPLPGASGTDASRFYPVYSPDGRWMVFTQAERGFFSQISSDLYVVPAGGGEARRLSCSSPLADTWHRFDPTGRWLAFVSNREDVRQPGVYVARFDPASGDCGPAIAVPAFGGPEAHVHAFSWSPVWPWLDAGLDPAVLADAAAPTVTGPGPYAPPEPGLQAALDALWAALRAGDEAALSALFIDELQFARVSDCPDPATARGVLQGRDQALARARQGPLALGEVALGPVSRMEIARGEAPFACRAREDVVLARATWRAEAGGRPAAGEVHLLQIDGAWRFTRI